jgi:CubicO group peptidase (beta-lactamase class C family)
MSDDTLSDFVEATATEFGIPGVAVGMWADDQEIYACHGVTNVDNPLPVDRDTLYVLGSVTKTYTATALMRLVAEDKVELDAPVRRYVPELKLADESAAADVTVLQLLNHTSGLGWDLLVDTGEGDDALAGYVAKLAELELIAPPGTRASYSQAGYSLLGRIVEKVTGLTYERAVASLVFKPLGLSQQFLCARGCHDEAVRRGPQSRRGRNARRRPAVARLTLPQPRRRHRFLCGRPAALGPVPSR